MIRLENIGFSYREHRVLREVSFSVEAGDFLGILGPNGSGKTTLIKVIDGILVPGEGTVFLRGKDIRAMKRRDIARTMAVVPQENPFVFSYTVEEIVLMGRSPHLGNLAFETDRDRDMARRALEETDTASVAGRSFNELSGGERQRVLIARALAQEPALLLLDEPTAFLDLRHQIAFMNLLAGLNREKGLTILAVTHDINLAALFCGKILLLKEGAVHSLGTPGDILTEEAVRDVYGVEARIDRHPSAGTPRVTVLPDRTGYVPPERSTIQKEEAL